ncbi:hypothetical protein KRP22_004288 [Phytophthora ramorum]|nr:hypothetical protein KRP22_13391 [Phytophthora ramorum]
MTQSTTRDSSSDAALRELERALDAFMATHVITAANSLAIAASKSGTEELGDLSRVSVDEEDDDEPVEVEVSTERRGSSVT